MIERQALLADLKPLLRDLQADLRARCDEVAEVNARLTKEYEEARAGDRVGVTFEEWRADLIEQVAVAWVLTSVFVRFLEDNALISPPRISGPVHVRGEGEGLTRARDERDLFFRGHPKLTDRDYLLAVFDELAQLPSMADVFGRHNLVNAYRDWLSGDAAQKLIEFFQKIDADGTGEIIHNFKDPEWDTRFLGDLYQDLSEPARKKYALLQTPVFVEEFILDLMLDPALKEFGLRPHSPLREKSGLHFPLPLGEGQGEGLFRMIDLACGSGHFLLGSFARILNHWRKAEPGTSERELVNRALASVHGVDLNPYAVAIARFRLLLAAMRECGITRLKHAPNFKFNLACGDSLLHGSSEQQVLGFHELAHHYQAEDIDELRRILRPGHYHVVVANPPYITVKDKSLNKAYREPYADVCHMKYSLVVPFMKRIFDLACENGFTGQITANSFMKREFGKKLVENYLPTVDLTHVVDTSGAYIPGHGTPTVILFGRKRRPVSSTVRAVMGIKGEPATPSDPAKGLVWSAILDQIDRAGSQSAFVSVSDTPREQFNEHPWSIGGGGAAELKELIDEAAVPRLGSAVESIGFASFTGTDEAFVAELPAFHRRNIPSALVKGFLFGEVVRDWRFQPGTVALAPYNAQFSPIPLDPSQAWAKYLWPNRSVLGGVVSFEGRTRLECGDQWWTWYRWIAEKYRIPLSIVFSFVATHNHFVLDRGGKVFNRSAPVIKLPAGATEDDHLALLGLLNSSTACFWMKQIFHNKGSTVDQHGARQRTMPFEDFWEHDGTKLQQFPLPAGHPIVLAKQLDTLARALAEVVPSSARVVFSATGLTEARKEAEGRLARMIAIQEELDWQCYGLYGLIPPGQISEFRCENSPPLKLGQRAFEIVLARKVEVGEEETSWFVRHRSTPITEIPAEWPEEYKRVVERRIELIERDRNIGLIERPEYKRRWNTEPWEQQQEWALRSCLLDRLESYFDFDGRMNEQKTATAQGDLREPRLTSVAKVTDLAKQDREFMAVAEVYTSRVDFDVANLVAGLIETESVPCLPVLRYKATGLDKRSAWERTWELQRQEDAVDALFEELVAKARRGKEVKNDRPIPSWLRVAAMHELDDAARYLTEAAMQNMNLSSDVILKPVTDAAKRAKQRAVGEIPVPPKYTSGDFLSADYWRLRGKLDVPKERWVSFPYCEGADGTMVIAWAGYDHLQLARAIAERYEQAKEHEGRTLVPLLACIGQLIPWLKQWHNDVDPAFGARMGDYFHDYLTEEAKALGLTVAKVMAWTPPAKTKKSNTTERRREGQKRIPA
jgi:SAM-dependent methyltransferase